MELLGSSSDILGFPAQKLNSTEGNLEEAPIALIQPTGQRLMAQIS